MSVTTLPETAIAGKRDIYEVTPDGHLDVVFHPGQTKAWLSEKRFTLITAGTQSGKTSFGPFWLEREIRRRGPGDYLIVTPTYALLDLKLLPELRRYFENTRRYGRYYASPRRHFTFDTAGEILMFGQPQTMVRTNIFFGYAEDPESLESMTVKAAWLDEAGQKKFKLGSWYAILRRLSLSQGRILITTTPYNLGWLYQTVFLPYKQNRSRNIEVVNFDSTQNPAFPREEWERARAEVPGWTFNMLYRGLFERPAGLIYEAFNRKRHVCKPFPIPPTWRRFLGLDFGAVNTVGLFYAQEPVTGRLFLYRTYKGGHKVAQQHVNDLLEGEIMIPYAVGGNLGEHNWRDEFTNAGLPVYSPEISDVEVGINRVVGGHQLDQIIVFEDQLEYLDQKESYSRVLDENGRATEKIDDPHAYHFMDAERYIVSYLRSSDTGVASHNTAGRARDLDEITSYIDRIGYIPSDLFADEDIDDDRY